MNAPKIVFKSCSKTHHKPVSVLDQNVARPSVALEEALQVALADTVRQSADVHSRPDHRCLLQVQAAIKNT